MIKLIISIAIIFTITASFLTTQKEPDGGLGKKMPPSVLIKGLLRTMLYDHPSAQQIIGDDYEIMYYRTQVVAGINFVIRIKDKQENQYACRIFMDVNEKWHWKSLEKIGNDDEL